MLERVNELWKSLNEDKQHPTADVGNADVTDLLYNGTQGILQSLVLGENQKINYLRTLNWQLIRNLSNPKKLAKMSEKEQLDYLQVFTKIEQQSKEFQLSVLKLCAKNAWAEKMFNAFNQEDEDVIEVEQVYVPQITEERRKELTEMLRNKINEKVRNQA